MVNLSLFLYIIGLKTYSVLRSRVITLIGSYADRRPPADLVPGSSAPGFRLFDTNGNLVQLSEMRGRKVLLTFFCGCPSCAQLALPLDWIHRQTRAVKFLAIIAMTADQASQWGNSRGITFPLLADPSHSIARLYSSLQCPRSWLIDEDGRIVDGSPIGASPEAILKMVSAHLRTSARPEAHAWRECCRRLPVRVLLDSR
jgi:peroxiredoxin